MVGGTSSDTTVDELTDAGEQNGGGDNNGDCQHSWIHLGDINKTPTFNSLVLGPYRYSQYSCQASLAVVFQWNFYTYVAIRGE